MKRKCTLLIEGLIIVLLLFSCTSKEMKKAKEFMEAGMYEQAIQLFEIEIQSNPKNAEASFLLGKCFIQTANHGKVEECFNRAILLNTDFKEKVGDIYFEKSLELYKSDDPRPANSYYQQGLKYNPAGADQFSEKLYNLASETAETKPDPSSPLDMFNVINQISPNYKSKIAEKTYSLAKSFIEKGFTKEGFEYADFGIKLDPIHIKDVADLYFNYASSLLITLNKPSESIPYFEVCIKLNPNRKIEVGNIYYNQAKVFEKNNDINLLLLFAKISKEINSDYDSWYKQLAEKYKPKIPTYGLVAYYPFNGNANDESGNRNNGNVYSASLSSDRKGIPNCAYRFNGNNSYIDCGNSNLLKISGSEITISLWICIKGVGLNYGRIVLGGSVNSTYTLTKNGYENKILWRPIGEKPNADLVSSDLSKDTWYHIIALYDGKTSKIYVNGILNNSKNFGGNISPNSKSFVIGGASGSHDGDWSAFDGLIDDVRIYNRALTEQDIQSLFKE